MTDAVVDAHVHLWDLRAMSLSWFRPDLGLPPTALLDGYDAAWLSGSTATPPGRLIVVQAGDTLREAAWLTRYAAVHPRIARVVLQYDARPAGSWAGMAQELIDHEDSEPQSRLIAGIRLATPSGAEDLGDVAGLDPLAEGLARTGRVLELLVRPAQLPAAAALAGRHPDLAVVLCHLGLGGERPDAAWQRGLDAVGARHNTAAKVSGLVRGTPDDAGLPRVLRHALTGFGPQRLLFGGDWPISARFAALPEVARRTRDALAEAGVGPGGAVWGHTAEHLYRLDVSSS